MLSPRPPAAHILTYAQTLDGGGAERAMLRLVRGWAEQGRRVTLVVGDARGPLARELAPAVETRVLGGTAMPALGEGVARGAAETGPDLLFCPGNHYSGLAAWVKLRLGRECPPIVAKVSNTLVRRDQSPPLAAAYRWWLRRHPLFVDRLVAMSPAMGAEAQHMTGVHPALLRVIPNPPAPRTPVKRGGDDESGALPPGRFLVGVGRLAPQKRWDRLISAFARVERDASLMILGEGAARPALEAQVAALGLRGRVRLPGHVADPAPAIRAAAALALVSDFEGVPGVLREALALGTPVVTTESSVAVREIVALPDQGTIVPFEGEDALVAALDDWLCPGRRRPRPVPEPGTEAAAAYLDLFDEVVLERRLGRGHHAPAAGFSPPRSLPLPSFAPAQP